MPASSSIIAIVSGSSPLAHAADQIRGRAPRLTAGTRNLLDDGAKRTGFPEEIRLGDDERFDEGLELRRCARVVAKEVVVVERRLEPDLPSSREDLVGEELAVARVVGNPGTLLDEGAQERDHLRRHRSAHQTGAAAAAMRRTSASRSVAAYWRKASRASRVPEAARAAAAARLA